VRDPRQVPAHEETRSTRGGAHEASGGSRPAVWPTSPCGTSTRLNRPSTSSRPRATVCRCSVALASAYCLPGLPNGPSPASDWPAAFTPTRSPPLQRRLETIFGAGALPRAARGFLGPRWWRAGVRRLIRATTGESGSGPAMAEAVGAQLNRSLRRLDPPGAVFANRRAPGARRPGRARARGARASRRLACLAETAGWTRRCSRRSQSS